MTRISAVIVARNEQENIQWCLESIKWCDEIIFVDMESDDHTVEIAKIYTNSIFSFQKVGYADPARGFGIGKATGDWVLIIDADEMVPKSLAIKLKEISEANVFDVVYIPFKTYIMGSWIRYTGWWPDYHPRFFRSGKVTGTSTLHVTLEVPESAKKIYLPAEDVDAISHYNYRDITHFVDKLNRYTTLHAVESFNKNESFSYFRPIWDACKEFIRRYVIYRGYKDGYRGFVLSVLMGMYRFLSRAKLWELKENEISNDINYLKKRQTIIDSYVKS